MKSAVSPRALRSLMPAWVGLVLCSPVLEGWGTRETCTQQKLSRWKESGINKRQEIVKVQLRWNVLLWILVMSLICIERLE